MRDGFYRHGQVPAIARPMKIGGRFLLKPHCRTARYCTVRKLSISGRLMSGEQFYINYSLNGEHYSIGPYHTRRFAMSHIDDVRRQPGVSNVFLGNKPPDDKSYRKRVPITKAMEGR
jgi:hypothetical protein